MLNTLEKFRLDGKICLITGGAGFLGKKHAEAILDAGGIPVLLDISDVIVKKGVDELKNKYNTEVAGYAVDITNKEAIVNTREKILEKYKKIDVLINNAANNLLKDKNPEKAGWTQLENFPEDMWDTDVDVTLKGSFLCTQVFGSHMAASGGGVILNISSDLGIIAPDQRIYKKDGTAEEDQLAKPVTYSVVKHGLIGLTKYTATYWADKGVRANAICPGGVRVNHDDAFVQKLTNLIPMGRMATADEYKAAILFLISDASSYMTGSTVIMDGGRTCW